jgi:hypothetical protein
LSDRTNGAELPAINAPDASSGATGLSQQVLSGNPGHVVNQQRHPENQMAL